MFNFKSALIARFKMLPAPFRDVLFQSAISAGLGPDAYADFSTQLAIIHSFAVRFQNMHWFSINQLGWNNGSGQLVATLIPPADAESDRGLTFSFA